MTKSSYSMYVDDDLMAEATGCASAYDRSVSWVIGQALALWLQIQPIPIIGTLSEDTDWAVIEQRIKQIKEGR